MASDGDAADTEPYFADFTKSAPGKRTPLDAVRARAVELAHWKSPQESGVVFAFGLVIIYMLSWSSRSVLSLTCLALALHLCISVITSLIYGTKSSKHATYKIDPETARQCLDAALVHVNSALAWYSELLEGRNLVQGLEVLAALIAAFIVGGWLSGATLVLLVWVGVFSLPALYVQNQKLVDDKVTLAKDKIDELIDKVSSQIPRAGAPAEPPAADKKGN